MDQFKLNPCKACLKKCDIDDINCINNCCYETQGAFVDAWSLNQFRNSPDSQNCVQCVNESIKAMGRDNCDMRLTAAPIFNQVPHYFPDLLRENLNPDESKKQCLKWCETCRYQNECMDNCNIDYDAVEKFKVDKPNNPVKKIKKPKPPKPAEPNYRKTNPISYYTALILGLILFGLFIYMFLKIFI